MQQLFGGPRLLLQLSFLQPQAKGGKWLGGAFWGEVEAEEEQPCTVWRGAGERNKAEGIANAKRGRYISTSFLSFFSFQVMQATSPRGISLSPSPCEEMKVGSYKGSSSVAVIVLPGGGRSGIHPAQAKARQPEGEL